MLRSANTFNAQTLCGVEYPWLGSQEARSRAIEGWKSLVGESLEVLNIPGDHFEVFNADNVSRSSSSLLTTAVADAECVRSARGHFSKHNAGV